MTDFLSPYYLGDSNADGFTEFALSQPRARIAELERKIDSALEEHYTLLVQSIFSSLQEEGLNFSEKLNIAFELKYIPPQYAQILWPIISDLLEEADPDNLGLKSECFCIEIFSALPAQFRLKHSHKITSFAKRVLSDGSWNSSFTVLQNLGAFSNAEINETIELLHDRIKSYCSNKAVTVNPLQIEDLSLIAELLPVDDKDGLWDAIAKQLHKALEAAELKTRIGTLWIIRDLPDRYHSMFFKIISETIDEYLSDHMGKNMSRGAFRSINILPEQMATVLLEKFSEKFGLTELTLQSPIHIAAVEGQDISFKDQHISKTVILGKTEKLQREIGYKQLEAWRIAYAARDIWIAKGLKEVPVEPIIDLLPSSEEGRITVVTVILRGESAAFSLSKYDFEIQSQILAEIRLIKETLLELGVNHTHAHLANFVLIPHKVDGQPDPTTKPKIKIIDFDLANYCPSRNIHLEKMQQSKRNFYAQKPALAATPTTYPEGLST